MLWHGSALTIGILATGTLVQRRIPETAGFSVAAVTPGRDQARALAIVDLSLPLCIWSASRSKVTTAMSVRTDCPRKLGTRNRVHDCAGGRVRWCFAGGQSLAVDDSMSQRRVSTNAAQGSKPRKRRVRSRCRREDQQPAGYSVSGAGRKAESL